MKRKIYFTMGIVSIALLFSAVSTYRLNRVIRAQTNNLQVEYKGWDPGLTKRRIATRLIDATYFESCPDEPNGCYGTIPSGGGFYTLSPDLGDLGIPCRVNSGETFDAGPGTGTQPCPFYFQWGTSLQDKLSAKVTINTTNWTASYTPHIYLGFQENLPKEGRYLGGENLPFINNYQFHASISAKATGQTSETIMRFLVGTAWYVPDLNKIVVLELNLDSVNASAIPEWNTTKEAVGSSFCPSGKLCLYLGGRYWGQPSILNKNPQDILFDWTQITTKLVQDGYLPSQVIGPYPAGIYTGPEIFGKVNTSLEVSDAASFSTSPTPNPLPGDLTGDGHVNIFDYNLFIPDFGKTGFPGFIPSDIDKNGKVDIFDYNLLVQNFGKFQ